MRVGAEGFAERIVAASAGLAAVETRLAKLQDQRENVEGKLQITGMKSTIGQLLVKHRQDLPVAPIVRAASSMHAAASIVHGSSIH